MASHAARILQAAEITVTMSPLASQLVAAQAVQACREALQRATGCPDESLKLSVVAIGTAVIVGGLTAALTSCIASRRLAASRLNVPLAKLNSIRCNKVDTPKRPAPPSGLLRALSFRAGDDRTNNLSRTSGVSDIERGRRSAATPLISRPSSQATSGVSGRKLPLDESKWILPPRSNLPRVSDSRPGHGFAAPAPVHRVINPMSTIMQPSGVDAPGQGQQIL